VASRTNGPPWREFPFRGGVATDADHTEQAGEEKRRASEIRNHQFVSCNYYRENRDISLAESRRADAQFTRGLVWVSGFALDGLGRAESGDLKKQSHFPRKLLIRLSKCLRTFGLPRTTDITPRRSQQLRLQMRKALRLDR
jgi:hypothetical protein